MIKHWQTLNGRWILFSKRERLMLFLVGVFGIAGLMDTYLTEPVRQHTQAILDEIVHLGEQTNELQQKITALQQTQPGVASPLQQQIEAVRAEVAAQELLLASLGDLMVPPREILATMKQLLTQHQQIKVLQLESLPPVSFVQKHLPAEPGGTATEEVDIGNIYQHSIRLRLQGSYAALTRYVSDLKKMGSTIAWETAQLKAQFPAAELSLEVYTLSTQSAWLGL